jgi:hypothetical protein
VLISAVRIIEKGDALLDAKKKPRSMRDKATSIINQSIDERFTKELGGATNILEIIEHAKFVSQDLVNVLEKVTKCFPAHYNIFELYQSRYQKNIQEKILPHMEMLTEEKQYGNLLLLMTWIEDYEAVLSRAGVASMSYA